MAQGPAICRGGSQRHVPSLWGPRSCKVGVKDRSCSGDLVQTTPTTSYGPLAGHRPQASVSSSVRLEHTARQPLTPPHSPRTEQVPSGALGGGAGGEVHTEPTRDPKSLYSHWLRTITRH